MSPLCSCIATCNIFDDPCRVIDPRILDISNKLEITSFVRDFNDVLTLPLLSRADTQDLQDSSGQQIASAVGSGDRAQMYLKWHVKAINS